MQRDGLHQLRDVRVAERGQVGDELVEELTEVARVRACDCLCLHACVSFGCVRACVCVCACVLEHVCLFVCLCVSECT